MDIEDEIVIEISYVEAAMKNIDRRYFTKAERDSMDESDFGDPENEAFPIKTADDVIHAAMRLHNARGNQADIKARITRIAKRKGFPLPATWEQEDKAVTSRS